MGEPITFFLLIVQLALWAVLICVITKFFWNRFKSKSWWRLLPIAIASFGSVVFVHDVWHFIDFRIYCAANAGFKKVTPVAADRLHYEGPYWFANALIASSKISYLSVDPRRLIDDYDIEAMEQWFFDLPKKGPSDCIPKYTTADDVRFFDNNYLFNLSQPICIEETAKIDPSAYRLEWAQKYQMSSQKYWSQDRVQDFAIRLVEIETGEVLSEYVAISDKRGWIERIITGGLHGRFTCIDTRPEWQRTYFFIPYYLGVYFDEREFLGGFLDRAILPVED